MKTKMCLMLIAVSMIVLSACSPTAAKPIKIAASVPKEVDFGEQMGDAIQMAFDETGGKIGDVPVELTIFDGGVTENKELANITSIKDDPQVVLYMGAYISAFARDVIPLANQYHLPTLSPAATWPGLTKVGYAVGEPGLYYPTGQRTFFRIVPADDLQGKVAVNFIKEQGYKSIYIVSTDDVYAQGLVNLLLANAESDGIPIVGQSHFDVNKGTAEDVKRVVAEVEAAKPDAVYLSIDFGEHTNDILKGLNTAAPQRPIMGTDVLVGTKIGQGAEALKNVYATVFKIAPDQTPELTAFVKKFQEKYSVVPTEYVMTGYEMAKVALNAVSRAGSAPTRDTVLKALRETKDYKGIMGTWSFDENGDTSYDTFSIVTLENGAWVPIKNASK